MANIHQKDGIKTAPGKNEAMEALRAGKKVEDIAKELGLSARTVFRYLDELKLLGLNQQNEEGDMPKINDAEDQIPTDPPEQGSPTPPPGTAAAMHIDETGFTFQVTLPPVVFTLFDMAKACKLVPEDKDLSSWLFENTIKRFELDYKLQLQLAPIIKEE